jgi:hypothetical protein
MSMTEYTIIPDGLHGFGVEVSAPNRFLSVRGFATELGAAAWIAEQQAFEAMVAAANGQSPWLSAPSHSLSALARASRDHAKGQQTSMRQLTHPLARYRRVAEP